MINFWSAECPWSERSDQAILGHLPGWGTRVIYLAVAGILRGVAAAADPVKEGAVAAVNALHGLGIATFMITGDHHGVAAAVAVAVGVDGFEAEVLPERKQQVVRE